MIVEAAAEGVMGQQYRFVPQLVDELDAATSLSLFSVYRRATDKKGPLTALYLDDISNPSWIIHPTK
jgi:hypothetical protein